MSRKILISGLSIVATLGIVGAATFAYFSDVANSTGNTFTAGTVNLQLDDNDESTFAESVSASIGGANVVAPGESVSGFVSLHNAGTIDMDEVEFGATQTSGETAPNLADVLDLTVLTGDDNTCTTNQVNQTASIATAIGNNALPLTLTELVNTDYDALPGLTKSGTSGDTYYVCVAATMQTGAGDEYQADSAAVDFVFTGHQDSSQ